MLKTLVDYRNHIGETVSALADGRVLLASCGNKGFPNVMAIGWGTLRIIWRKPIFHVLVRPSRHSYKLIEETGDFTVNVVPPELKEVASYCGTVSGRDHDKFKEKGTDYLGRDMFSRTLYSARVSLSIGIVGEALSFVLGFILGGISGYVGVTVDILIQRLVEFMISIPSIPIWMAFSAAGCARRTDAPAP